MGKLLRMLAGVLPTLLVLLGAGAVTYGVALLCLPAGIITGGALTMGVGALLMLGGEDG